MLDKVREKMLSVFTNKKMIMILLLAGIFILVAIWVYNTYVIPRLKQSYVPNKEYTEEGTDNKSADVYFFYTTWCPHCKTAKPEWEKFKENINTNGHSSGVKLTFIEVDCEKDQATAEKFNVAGYPTIKMLYNNDIVEYDAKPQQDTLHQFLDSVLNT
jgi:thiol-disulfide isomerase/thioredoxin